MHQMKTSLAENGYLLVELRGSMPTKDSSKEEAKKSDAKRAWGQAWPQWGRKSYYLTWNYSLGGSIFAQQYRYGIIL